ncbi:MAG TPA: hypothetical protein VER17_10045, partial [Tepidisphaeraceae bacterium]|nr:hypothetical protein [Tepidisphaeraceae bacterium]
MTKLLPRALGLLAAAVASQRAQAQLVYEPFAYPVASALDNQINPGNGQAWSRMGTGDDIALTAGNLPYAGLAPASGNSAFLSGSGRSQRLSLGAPISSGTTYYSLSFQVTTLGAMETLPAFVAGFSNGSGTSGTQPQTVGTRLYLRRGSQENTFNVGVSKNSSNVADIAFDATDFALNTPIFVVGSYAINGSIAGSDDQAKLWINPTALGAAAAPAGSAPGSPVLSAPVAGTDLLSAGAPSLRGFVLRQDVPDVPGVQVDELRVANTWAQVTPPAGITWTGETDGTWSTPARWSTGAVPNDPSSFVNFPSANNAARTVTVDAPVSLRTINFTGTAAYTIGASAGGSVNFSGSSAINVLAAGNHTIAAPVNLSDNLLASVRSGSTLTVSGDLSSGGFSLTKAGAGTLQLRNARVDELNVSGGRVNILPNGSTTGVSKVKSLAVNGPVASLDLVNNDLIIDYTGASPLGTLDGSTYTGVTGSIQSGRNAGAWNGAGILASQAAAANPAVPTTLGVAEAAKVLGLSGSQTAMWRGQIVDATSLLLKYTYAGDADLNGKINGDDYFLIDSHVAAAAAAGNVSYYHGDFNYDGKINGDDYFLIDSNVGGQGTPMAEGVFDASPAVGEAVASVPEPASLAGAVAVAAAMV